MEWLRSIADYGVDIVSLGVMAFVLIKVLPNAKKDPNPELIEVIRENTKASTELVVVIRQQGELIKDLVNDFTNVRLELAKGRDRQ